jgi:hypothetical protein
LASGCIVVCSKNYVYDGKICQPCATLFALQIDLKYYSFWNASDSARWWPAESDSMFGMTARRTSGLEHRVSIPNAYAYPKLWHLYNNKCVFREQAGVCWPCPKFVNSVYDLCDQNVTQSMIVASFLTESSVVVYKQVNNPPLLPPTLVFVNVNSRRRILAFVAPPQLLLQPRQAEECPPYQQCTLEGEGECNCACSAGAQPNTVGCTPCPLGKHRTFF